MNLLISPRSIPLFLFPHTGVSSAHWRFSDAGRTAGGMITPSAGGFGTSGGPWAEGFLHPLGGPGRWGIPGIPGELPAVVRWWNRRGDYALFRTRSLRGFDDTSVYAELAPSNPKSGAAFTPALVGGLSDRRFIAIHDFVRRVAACGYEIMQSSPVYCTIG